MSPTLVTCLSCGWVHMRLSREEAQRNVDNFNEFFNALPEHRKLGYYGGHKSALSQYQHCVRCGSTNPMRPFEEGDCPEGVTIQATIL